MRIKIPHEHHRFATEPTIMMKRMPGFLTEWPWPRNGPEDRTFILYLELAKSLYNVTRNTRYIGSPNRYFKAQLGTS